MFIFCAIKPLPITHYPLPMCATQGLIKSTVALRLSDLISPCPTAMFRAVPLSARRQRGDIRQRRGSIRSMNTDCLALWSPGGNRSRGKIACAGHGSISGKARWPVWAAGEKVHFLGGPTTGGCLQSRLKQCRALTHVKRGKRKKKMNVAALLSCRGRDLMCPRARKSWKIKICQKK